MDFDDAKENIQPLAQGRNASILHASLRVESSQELLTQRKELEKEIHNYNGDDPLSVWYNYIEWIEQSFPSGGKESGLQEVLYKCLAQFESEEKYKQDRRMIKLYIKFIESHNDPAECYQQLYSAGIGTMVADFYIAWAYCYDLIGNTRKADEIFVQGIACRAEPLEELQEARQHFGFSVAQRLLYKDEHMREQTNRELRERRMALTSLRGHRRKQIVGSIRTGSAVKASSPGTVKINLPSTSSQQSNERVQVFKDENESLNVIATSAVDSTLSNEAGKSVVRSIIDAARNQENKKEPGPWNKALDRKKENLFSKSSKSNDLGFEIHVDDLDNAFENIKKPCIPPIPISSNDIKFDKPFCYPMKFCAISKPIIGWLTPVTTEQIPDKNSIPEYNKCKLYPRPNMEFQPEELKAYNVLKKHGIENEFTKERDEYWGYGPSYNIRLYPHFATQSLPQKNDLMDQIYIPEKIPGLKVAFEEIYNKENNVEMQFEEILDSRIKRNETIITSTDMEETICVPSEKVQRRKSFFPVRKSVAPSTFKDSNQALVLPDQKKVDQAIAINVIPQLVKTESACSKTVESDSKPTINAIKSPKLFEKNQIETELQPAMASEMVVPGKNMSKPFEIFVDDGAEEAECIKSHSSIVKSPVVDANDFQFKTPANPIASSTLNAVASNKLQFEIFDDETVARKSPNNIPKSDFNCSTGVFFDADETCSTQTFNIFLKAQSVSTPKAVTKLQNQNQFGNILKELTSSSIPEQKDEQHITSPIDNPKFLVVSTVPAVYSPPRQQLSTILETSEHGSTQGTHTTGTTTKSTISSPEFDGESQVQTTTNAATYQQPPILETVKELSCETSLITNEIINSVKIECNTDIKAKEPEKNAETPAAIRLHHQSESSGFKFSIFEDSIKPNNQVGNFSRLEEKEDTATNCAFKAMPSIRFQDDKTETIPKILTLSQQDKLRDDKTETMSKMIFEEVLPIKFPDEKTETISKLVLEPPKPEIFDDEVREPIVENREKIQHHVDLSHDDSFEFFRRTPPKSIKQMDQHKLSQVRTASNTQTPLQFVSKRFCDKDTPKVQNTNVFPKTPNLFDNELESSMKDSFLPEFSLIEEKQQSKTKAMSKSVLRDSFIPDFSIIEDSEPDSKKVQAVNRALFHKSTLPELSLAKTTQPISAKLTQINKQNPPTESIIASTDPFKYGAYLKEPIAVSAPAKDMYPKTSIEETRDQDNPNTASNKTQFGNPLKDFLMNTFMNDFSDVNGLRSIPNKNESSLKFLNESFKPNAEYERNIHSDNFKIGNLSIGKDTKLNFRRLKDTSDKSISEEKKGPISNDDEKHFEYNCETEMFATNISKIKNSTWLPSHEPFGNENQLSNIQRNSLHIKPEQVSFNSVTSCSVLDNQQPSRNPQDSIKSKQSSVEKSVCNNDIGFEIRAPELAAVPTEIPIASRDSMEQNDYECENSIYYKQTSKTPKSEIHIWDDADIYKSSAENHYVHSEPDLNVTNQVIANLCVDPNMNPFNVDLINAFLEQHDVISFIESLPTCQLVHHISRIKQNAKVNINDINFDVIKLIGEGAYGAVFCGIERNSGKLVAMKQERPPNFWEYYICLEIQERIRTDEMLQCYMSVDYALIGNNASILVSNYSQYGSLISVCNKIKKHTLKNVDEYVVMLLTSELLEIIDHLHAANIIHADVKADNFLLMNKLTYPPTERCLQLIDFGVSIDMKLFKQGQVFSFVHNDNSFKCAEMREGRPWTYQLDLFGLAGVLHVLLFGKYMDIEKKGFWMHKTHVPRYLNKNLWEEIFKTLLNVRDCKSMPNLQYLRALLKKEIEDREKYVFKMVNEFNRALLK